MKTLSKIKILGIIAAIVLIVAIIASSAPLFALADEQSDVVFDEDSIIKVVNVTDGSYRLEDDEYSIVNGELVIDGSYLYTLEGNTTYTFRVVTADGDYDVSVATGFTAPTLTADAESFTRGDVISFILSENVVIYGAELDGSPVEYTREGNRVILSSDAFTQMTAGEHTVKLFTSKGRPSLRFTLEGLQDDIWQEIVPINYTWFIIDMAIFGSAILAYIIFVVIKKVQKRRIKAQ